MATQQPQSEQLTKALANVMPTITKTYPEMAIEIAGTPPRLDWAGSCAAAINAMLHDKLININDVDQYGYSMLHHAALYGNSDVTSYLLIMGINPLIKSKKGETAYEYAKRFFDKHGNGTGGDNISGCMKLIKLYEPIISESKDCELIEGAM